MTTTFAPLPLQEIEFTTVTLNERGEIQDRPVHRARQFVEPLGNGLDLELIACPADCSAWARWASKAMTTNVLCIKSPSRRF